MDNNHDIHAAMLGDHEAAKRLTDAGVLLGCPWCKKTPTEDDLFYRWEKYSFSMIAKPPDRCELRGKPGLPYASPGTPAHRF